MDPSNLLELRTFNQHTTFYIKPEHLTDFWEAFKPFCEKTVSAPECLYFEVFEDHTVPGRIVWIVNWNQSPEWVATVQFAKEEYKSYFAATASLFSQEPEQEILQRTEGYVSGKKGNFVEMGGMAEGFSLHVTVYIKPECLDGFWREWEAIFGVVAREEECLYFEVFEDPVVPGKISWVENWSRGPTWFQKEQITKEYYKPYLAATGPMFAKDREIKILKRKAGLVFFKPENFEGATVGDYRS